MSTKNNAFSLTSGTSDKVMSSILFLVLPFLMVQLINGAGALVILKCCEPREIMDVRTLSCKPSEQLRNISLQKDEEGVKVMQEAFIERMRAHKSTSWGSFWLSPSERWLREWLPPGLPRIHRVWAGTLDIVLADPLRLPVALWPIDSAIFTTSSSTSAEKISPTLNDSSSPQMTLTVNKINRVTVRHSWAIGEDVRVPQDFYSYCVDRTSEAENNFLAVINPVCLFDTNCLHKCCLHGEELTQTSEGVHCITSSNYEWSPVNSSLQKYLQPSTKYVVTSSMFVACDGFFSVTSSEDEDFENILDNPIIYNTFSTHFLCADYKRDDQSRMKEVVAYCSKSRLSSGLYKVLRAMSGVSTVLLLVAVVLILREKRMRRTTHGRALLCHASCLLGFDVLQLAFSYAIAERVLFQMHVPKKLSTQCTALGISAYFFMTASGFWLTVMCINMTLGFRLQTKRKLPKHFRIVWSNAVGWGGPFLLTLVSALNFQINIDRKWYSPSFSETRTCFHDLIQVAERVPWYRSNKHSGLLFYYLPMALLICANAVCLGRVLCQIKMLQRGNSVLQRAGDVTNVRRTRNLLVYVKLAMCAGAVELVAEAVSWGGASADTWRERDSHAVLQYSAPFRIAGLFCDLLRAISVLWLALPARARTRQRPPPAATASRAKTPYCSASGDNLAEHPITARSKANIPGSNAITYASKANAPSSKTSITSNGSTCSTTL